MAIGDAISESAPAVGTAGPGYATTINALLTEFKARLTAKIPLSSLLANSNLDLNGQALLNAEYITLLNEGVSPVASPVNRIAAFSGDFWWVSPSGAIRITAGNQLNAAGVGGITGDYYGAGPMEFRYDLGNTRYDAFANQSTNTWAYVRARGFDIAGGATSAFRLRHQYTGTANRTITWPDNVGTSASGDILKMDNAGLLITTEAISQFENTYHPNKYQVVSAYDIYSRGNFTGAGGQTLSVTANVPKYRLDTAGGVNTFPLYFDNEGTVALANNPIFIQGIFWKGLINGGGYPVLEIFRHRSTGGGVLDEKLPTATTVPLTLVANTSDVVESSEYTVDTPFTMNGDEYLTFRITAGTNNCDTYHVVVIYDKQS